MNHFSGSQFGSGTALLDNPAADFPKASNLTGGQPGRDKSQTGVAAEMCVVASHTAKTVSVCDTQPVTAEGIRTLLQSNQELTFAHITDSLQRALEAARRQPSDVLLVDKAFGIQGILEWLNEVRVIEAGQRTGIVIWGVSIT